MNAILFHLQRYPSLLVHLDIQNQFTHLYMRDRASLTLSGASSATGVAPHGDGLLVLQDIAEVGEGALKFPAVNGLSGLAGVLEGDTEVGTASAGALCVVEAGCSVTNLGTINFAFERCCSSFESSATVGDNSPFCRAMRSCVVSKVLCWLRIEGQNRNCGLFAEATNQDALLALFEFWR